MKPILVYSIHHTGTWFAIDFIKAAFHKDQIETMMWGEVYSKEHRLQLSNLPEISSTDRYGKCILYAHKNNTNTKGITHSLTVGEPNIPVIIPMRDPLLSLCTKIWRRVGGLEAYLKETNTKRFEFTKQHIDKFKEVLVIPKSNRFLLPIDVTAKRNKLYNELYEYCNLEKTRASNQFRKQWKPVNNTTRTWFKQWKKLGKTDNKTSRNIKKEILAGYTKTVKGILGIEFNFMTQQNDLKEYLKELGYSNLTWW